MKNWKTTAAGILAAIGQILPLAGVPAPVSQAISVIGLALLGILAKDHNITGGTIEQ